MVGADQLRAFHGLVCNAGVWLPEKSDAGVAEEQLDCVVIGGGFLGLTALAQLRSEGYRAVLVTESGLGEGQSLHSHGWFHAGYLPGDADTAKTWKAGSAKTEAMLSFFLTPLCFIWRIPIGTNVSAE